MGDKKSPTRNKRSYGGFLFFTEDSKHDSVLLRQRDFLPTGYDWPLRTGFLIEVRCLNGRPKRQAKPTADDGFWDCSVCTFRNSAEAFKCSICDVRKGTSTRYGHLQWSSAALQS
ncbi:hypothetical protein cypCar_00017482 [Cyprinus carpio]|nr:hypothetical protein cypCar_00017482 [Cyprinus carpio]